MSVFVHPHGICESANVGAGTRIWAFAHVLPGARVGRDCNICDHVFIENDVVIGDRVTIKCGVQVWDGVRIADDVFVGPNATFTNDQFPRSKMHRRALQTSVGPGASLSANCTVLPGVSIGRGAMVGAGAVVTHSVPARAIVVGNPARIKGYVDVGNGAAVVTSETPTHGVQASTVRGVTLHRLPVFDDLRGTLSVGRFGPEIPFAPARFFVVHHVPGSNVRGEHAHRACQQFLTCVAGSVTVLLDDGRRRTEVLLDKPSIGLHIGPMVWATQFRHSPDAVVVVFASDQYDPLDYIRDYEEFLRIAAPDPSSPGS